MFKNIIWDFDGTLFDTYTAQTSLLSKIVETKYGINIPIERIREFTSKSLSFTLNEISRIVNTNVEEIESLFIEEYALLPLDREYPYAYVVEICNKIVSKNGFNIINTHRGKERLLKLLKKYKMEHLFCDIISYEDNFPRKPDPKSFYALIERNCLLPKETLVIGDRELDIKGGQNAGLKTYFFNSNLIDMSNMISDYKEKDLKRVSELI